MCGITCGIATTVVGAVLVVVVGLVGYVAVPGIIENIIESEVVLLEDTIQMDRFEEIPFPLTFSVRVWNISNPAAVFTGGVPEVSEIGPYVYKVYQRRIVHKLEDDLIHYRIVMDFEFDAEASFPNTEDDIVTIVNVPYHAILQVAESMFPALMPALAAGLNGIFGAANNRPVVDVRVRDLLFDGIPLCENPGLIAAIACTQRNGNPSGEYTVHRGLEDSSQLAHIKLFESLPHLLYWMDGEGGRGSGLCNMINGTDSGIFAPFIDRDKSLYAINTDICRSVELRYQYDTEYAGIPAVRYSANEWFLDNHERCFCLNVTRGTNADDGCLLRGAMEIYTCVGAFLVLTYPHFLYADGAYSNGVIGVNPKEEEHRIFLDLDPNTGTVIRGQKRAQFNVFMRPVTGVSATQNLRTTLTPIFWVEEGMSLPEEYVDELKTRLLRPLNLVDILIPVLLALSALVFALGLIFLVRAKITAKSLK